MGRKGEGSDPGRRRLQAALLASAWSSHGLRWLLGQKGAAGGDSGRVIKSPVPMGQSALGTRGLSRLMWFLLSPTPPHHPAISPHFPLFPPCLTWLGPQPIAVAISWREKTDVRGIGWGGLKGEAGGGAGQGGEGSPGF